jgi:hypothetical protein
MGIFGLKTNHLATLVWRKTTKNESLPYVASQHAKRNCDSQAQTKTLELVHASF